MLSTTFCCLQERFKLNKTFEIKYLIVYICMIKNIVVYQKGTNNTNKYKRLLDTMYFSGKTLKL